MAMAVSSANNGNITSKQQWKTGVQQVSKLLTGEKIFKMNNNQLEVKGYGNTSISNGGGTSEIKKYF